MSYFLAVFGYLVSITRVAFVGILIGGLCLPLPFLCPNARAQEQTTGDEGGYEGHHSYTPDPERDAIPAPPQVKHTPAELLHDAATQIGSGKTGIGLALSDDAREIGLLDGQKVVYHQKNGNRLEYDLDHLDISIPDTSIASGLLERSITISPRPNGMEISYAESTVGHEIKFRPGEELQSHTVNRNNLVVLTTAGRIFSVPFQVLYASMYRSKVPMSLIRVIPFERLANVTGIKTIQRRPFNNDRSTAGQESRLDLRENWANYQVDIATRDSVARMQEDLAKVTSVPLSAELRKNVETLRECDIAIIGTVLNTEEIIDIVASPEIHAKTLALFDTLTAVSKFIQGDVAALKGKSIDEMNREFLGPLMDALKSPEELVKLYSDGNIEKLSLIDPNALKAGTDIAKSSLENSPNRDEFTPETWERSSQVFSTTVAAAKESVGKQSKWVPRFVRKIAASATHGVGLFDRRTLSKLSWFLKGSAKVAVIGAAGVGVDALAADSAATQYAVQLTVGSWDWLMNSLPVLSIPGYVPLLAQSLSLHSLILPAILGATALFSGLTQYGPGQLYVRTGVQLYGIVRWMLTYPMGPIAYVTKQGAMMKSWRLGVFSWPHLTNAQVEKQNEKARQTLFKEHISTIVGVVVAAHHLKLDPGELLMQMEGKTANGNSDDNFAKAAELSAYVRSQLELYSSEDLVDAVNADPKAVQRVLCAGIKAAEELLAEPNRESTMQRWVRYWKVVVGKRVMQSLGTTTDQMTVDLLKAEPTSFVVSQSLLALFVDYYSTIATSALVGDWADPARPEHLRAQANGILLSTPNGRYETFGDIQAHSVGGAASRYLLFNNQVVDTSHKSHSPALSDNQNRQVSRTLPFLRELTQFLGAGMNLRQHNAMDKTVEFYQNRVYGLTAGIFWATWLRLLMFPDNSVSESVLATMYVMTVGMFTCFWPWPIYEGAASLHNQKIEERYVRFEKAQIALRRTFELDSEEDAETAIAEMNQVYDSGDFRYANMPKPEDGETSTQFALRLQVFSLGHPPVAAQTSHLISQTGLLAVGVVTTFLATYLMSAAVDHRTVLGANLPDLSPLAGITSAAGGTEIFKALSVTAVNIGESFNLFKGIPEGDGLISLIVKVSGLLYTGLVLKRSFDVAWDWSWLNIPGLKGFAKARGTLDSIKARYEGTKDKPGSKAKLSSMNPMPYVQNTVSTIWRTFAGPVKPSLPALREDGVSCASGFTK